MKRFTIQGVRPDDKADHARRETLNSLMDIARFPDGTPRNGRAGALIRDELTPRSCEVSEALGLGPSVPA